MKGEERSGKVLKDLREVNQRVDSFIKEVNNHIEKTNREIKERNQKKALRP